MQAQMEATGNRGTGKPSASQAEELPQVLMGHSMGAGCVTAEVLEHSKVSIQNPAPRPGPYSKEVIPFATLENCGSAQPCSLEIHTVSH